MTEADQLFDCSDERGREAGLAAAVDTVRGGGCVVLPTDTVYGIGADAFSAQAVQRLLDAKGRGRDMPPPVLIGDPVVLMALGRDIPDNAKRLAEAFWPGPLTLIVRAQGSLQMDLGETRGTIAVRVPDHELARELLRRTGPMAVSSANRSGSPAATDVADARSQLGDSVAVYLDGGATPGSEPSTIIDFTTSDYGTVVRHGALRVETLREVVTFLGDAETEGEPEADRPAEPGPEEPSGSSPASVLNPQPPGEDTAFHAFLAEQREREQAQPDEGPGRTG